MQFGAAKPAPSNQVEDILGAMSPLHKPAASDNHGSVSFAGKQAGGSEMSIDSSNTTSTRRAPLGEVQVSCSAQYSWQQARPWALG